MNNHFKTAMDQVKAEEALILRTSSYLKNVENKNVRRNHFLQKGNQIMKKYAVAAALAVALIGGGSGVYGYYKIPVNYLSVDVNPSIELGVSMSGDVVEVEGINEDGNTVLEGVDVIGTTVEEAVQTIVESATENNFIEEDGSSVVSITTETDSDSVSEELTNAAEEGVTQALENENVEAEVIKSKIALDRRDQARELGISPGKLNLIQKLQKLDSTVTVDQYKDAKVKEIMKAIKDKKKEVKADLKEEVKEEIDQTIEEGKTEIDQTIEEGKAEIKQNVEQKKSEIKQQVEQKKSEIKQKIEQKKAEVKEKVQQIKAKNKNNGTQTTVESTTESNSQ
ncbi:MAG: hypothetical protein K0R71_1824 [Bacillales bacterium]|jgi:hypothetical protein|nr:hypothetical protein [Bacillales bacterium]